MRDEFFERLYEEHAEALLSFLVFRTGDRALAEDLLADTFERVLRRRRTFDRRKGGEKNWLYAIAMNCMRDHFRRRDAESRALARLEQERPATWSGEAEGQISDRDEVMRALEELSDQERDDIALRYGAGLAVPEIADLLGQPLTTVESRFYRALRKLRDRLPPRGE